MGLTKVEVRTKWPYGTSIHDILLERFPRRFSILQEAGRARDGTMPGRRLVRSARCRVEFGRDRCEAHGREHAFAVDGFSDHGWREAGPESRHRIRGRAENTSCADGTVGARMETCFRRARAAE